MVGSDIFSLIGKRVVLSSLFNFVLNVSGVCVFQVDLFDL